MITYRQKKIAIVGYLSFNFSFTFSISCRDNLSITFA
jgi:hypothetical protein